MADPGAARRLHVSLAILISYLSAEFERILAPAWRAPAGHVSLTHTMEDRVTPIIYGTEFSTYVRSVRIAFEEKGAQYTLHDVSVLKGEHKQTPHLARNPFGTVPAFEHDGLEIYETSPILRYLDQVFPGPALTPEDPRQRARMNQIISIIDYHGYASMIGQIVVQRLFTALLANGTDESIVKAGIPRAQLCLKEFERIKGASTFLAGNHMSLADLYLVPIIFYLKLTPESEIMAPFKGLDLWWQMMTERKTVKATAPNLG